MGKCVAVTVDAGSGQEVGNNIDEEGDDGQGKNSKSKGFGN